MLQSLNQEHFFNCSKLQSSTIPNNVTSIVPSVFYDCRSLTSMIFLENVESIGSGIFNRCSSLVNMSIPKRITKLEDFFFLYLHKFGIN